MPAATGKAAPKVAEEDLPAEGEVTLSKADDAPADEAPADEAADAEGGDAKDGDKE